MYTSAYFDILLPEKMAWDTERPHLIGLLSVTFFYANQYEETRLILTWSNNQLR